MKDGPLSLRFTFFVSVAVMSLIIKPLGFIFLLAFPFLPVVKVSRRNALLCLPILISLNMLASIINAVLLDSLNLPVNWSLIIALALIETIAFLYIRPKKFEFNIPKSNLRYFYFIYGLFALAIVSRLVSVIHLHVPILHDPEAHAFWANRILNEKAIDYFYSPGLHIWSWLFSEASGASIARSVHVVTNFFSSLTVLAWALAAYIFTKSGRIAVWTGLLMLLIPIPQFLYFMAGKNSFIMSISFIALTAVFSRFYYQRRTGINFMLVLVCLIGVGLVHYPAFAFAVGMVSLYLLTIYAADNLKLLAQSPLFHLKSIARLMLPVVLAMVFIGANVYVTKSEEVDTQVVSSNSEAQHYSSVASESETVPDYQALPKQIRHKTITVNNPVAAARQAKDEYLAFNKSMPKDIGVIMSGVFIAGIYFLLAHKPTHRQLIDYHILLISFTVSGLAIVLGLAVFQVKGLGTTSDTGLLLSPLIAALPVAWLFAHISKRKALEVLAITSLAVLASLYTFGIFRAKSTSVVVDAYDVQAFEWIDANIDDSEKFIGLSRPDPNRASIIFPVDGALWLPVFTGNETATPFHQLGFTSVESQVNHQHSLRLGRNNPGSIRSSIQYYRDNDFDFIYVDGEIAYHELGIDRLIDMGLGEIVYRNPEVQILEITAED